MFDGAVCLSVRPSVSTGSPDAIALYHRLRMTNFENFKIKILENREFLRIYKTFFKFVKMVIFQFFIVLNVTCIYICVRR